MSAIESYSNGAVTTVATAIGSTDLVLVVVATTNFPGGGNFHVKIDAEILLVTAVAGTTWTVTRGVEGTVATAHDVGANVYNSLTMEALLALFVQMHGGAAVGSRRAINFVDSASVVWTLTDDGTNAKMDVSAAASGGGGGGGAGDGQSPLVAPPLSTTFAWVNQGGATATDDAGGLYLIAPPVAGNNGRMLVKATPGSPYTFTAKAYTIDFYGSSHVQGICLRESASGQFIRFGFNAGYLLLDKFNSPTSYAGSYQAFNCGGAFNHVTWFRVQDDGTNLTWSVSVDGTNWWVIQTGSRTDFLTPDQYGLFCESNDSVHPAQIKFVSLAVTTP